MPIGKEVEEKSVKGEGHEQADDDNFEVLSDMNDYRLTSGASDTVMNSSESPNADGSSTISDAQNDDDEGEKLMDAQNDEGEKLMEALRSGRISHKEAEDILNSFQQSAESESKVELEYIDDDVGPEPTAAVLEESLNAAEKQATIVDAADGSTNVEYIDEEEDGPFNVSEFEDEDDDAMIMKKKNMNMKDMNQTPAAAVLVHDEDSIHVPTRDDIEGEDNIQGSTNTNIEGGSGTNRRGWGDIESRQQSNPSSIARQTQANVTGSERSIAPIQADERQDIEQGQSGIHIPEAFLVEDSDDGEVVIAIPTLPWWKQRKTKIFLGVIIVIVVVFSIALGVSLSQSNPSTTVFLNGTSTPSVSIAPSTSVAPSSSPSECVDKIISNTQEIDLSNDIQVNDPQNTTVSIDGRNMVVLARDAKYSNADGRYEGPAYITFYRLDNNDEWQRVQSPIRVDNTRSYSVGLSGSTAFVGILSDSDTRVHVYEQNKFGEWDRVYDPFFHYETPGFLEGWEVEIDGDLACESDRNNIRLYHRNGKWDMVSKFVGQACSITGDIVVITELDGEFLQLYKFNGINKVYPIEDQDPILTGGVESMDLINDYLAYSDKAGSDVFIYQRNATNQIYTLHQQLNMVGSKVKSVALDSDMLVVGGNNHTHIYSLQNGRWEETLTLHESYDDYTISGRTLIGFSSSVVGAFDIEDCSQPVPTQSPSTSIPTRSPSLTPSLSPTVSSSPSTTFKCFGADDGGRDGILYDAVRSYIDQDCINNEECDVGQTYGWPMNSWCVGSVRDMSYLFDGMDTFNEDISGWDTGRTTDMQGMFQHATEFNRDLPWNMTNVENVKYMFWNASSFNGDVSLWQTSSITDMGFLFWIAAAFNGDLSSWNTSSVRNMRSGFASASSFNGNIATWDTGRVFDMQGMFYNATSFNIDISGWNTSRVESFEAMFMHASSFNQDLPWDTSSAFLSDKGMVGVFYNAASFNGDVSSWDISSVRGMWSMFGYATSFNKDLCAWRDKFPYNVAVDNIFKDSGCTYQDTPQEDKKGPFCASDCVSSPPESP